MHPQQTLQAQKNVVAHVLTAAADAGWSAREVFVRKALVHCASQREVLEQVFGQTCSVVYFFRPGIEQSHFVAIDLANGVDCVVDHSQNHEVPGGHDFEGLVIAPNTAYALSLLDSEGVGQGA